jgi:formylglycine-generating enzyme required for sulfatase activity
LPKVGGQAADAAGFVEEVRERSGLLVEAELGTYRFSHLTFQEYLAAREVANDRAGCGILVANTGSEWWEEVMLLYAGMADATAVVEALLSDEMMEGMLDDVWPRVLLAGRCVAQAARVEEASREHVVGQLKVSLEALMVSGEMFLLSGQVLAEIANRDSVDFFLDMVRECPRTRSAALWSLGEMGRQENEALRKRVLQRLLAHLQREDLRETAAAALVEVWGLETLAELRERRIATPLVELVEYVTVALAERIDAMMVTVPAGEFLMGDDRRKVHVDALRIDCYPVTNVQYKRFVDATRHRPPSQWENGDYPPEKALHPVVYVTWPDAVAYAEWAGKRLPTEEEWEKAARGTDGREYPWGDWEEGRCNSKEAGIIGTTPVGQYSPDGDSPYGCADMAGNVLEWTASRGGGGHCIVRGGAWLSTRVDARCAYRFGGYSSFSLVDIGFRCVSPVSGSEF